VVVLLLAVSACSSETKMADANSKIGFWDGDDEIFVMNADGTGVRQPYRYKW
jgi:hypothetical protein